LITRKSARENVTVDVMHPRMGPRARSASRLVSIRKAPDPKTAPMLGEHSEEILRELGDYGDDRIDALSKSRCRIAGPAALQQLIRVFNTLRGEKFVRIWRSLLFGAGQSAKDAGQDQSLPADGFISTLRTRSRLPERECRAMAGEYIARTPGKQKLCARERAAQRLTSMKISSNSSAMPGLAACVVPKQDTPGDVAALDRI